MAEHKTGLNAPWHEDVESTLMQMAKSYAILQNTIDLMLAGIRVQTRDLVVEGPDDDITPEEERLWHHCQGRRLSKHIKLLGRLLDCKVKADNQYLKVLRLMSYLRELPDEAVKAEEPHDRQSDLYQKLTRLEIAKAKTLDEKQKTA
jgi:hypothetical protein